MTGSAIGYVFTGGPGFGKSSVLESLAAQGYSTVPEAPRQMILEQREIPGGVLPRDDFAGFALLVLRRMEQQHREAAFDDCLFDRGVPDIMAYMEYAGLGASDAAAESARRHRYRSPVFLFPPWEEIYGLDGVRYESYAQAETIGTYIERAYRRLDYEILTVPRGSLAERVDFVRRHLPAPSRPIHRQ